MRMAITFPIRKEQMRLVTKKRRECYSWFNPCQLGILGKLTHVTLYCTCIPIPSDKKYVTPGSCHPAHREQHSSPSPTLPSPTFSALPWSRPPSLPDSLSAEFLPRAELCQARCPPAWASCLSAPSNQHLMQRPELSQMLPLEESTATIFCQESTRRTNLAWWYVLDVFRVSGLDHLRIWSLGPLCFWTDREYFRSGTYKYLIWPYNEKVSSRPAQTRAS